MMVKEGSQYYNYKYNADGIRIRKNANGITYTYFLDDSGNLIGEKRVGPGVNLRLTYEYDATGILAFGFSDTITGQRGKLYYQKNLQGDIIGINWASGVTACIYDYDAWGNVILKSGDAYILSLNRILYRGYYQDIETGWYYLQSRYYDPSICRFINADDIELMLELGMYNLGAQNLYSYCFNNPVRYRDDLGSYPKEFLTFIERFFIGLSELDKFLTRNGPDEITKKGRNGRSKRQATRDALAAHKATEKQAKTFSKVANIVSYTTLAIDVGATWYDHYKGGDEKWAQNALIESIEIITRFAISAAITSACTTLIPVPILGTVVGVLLSILVDTLIVEYDVEFTRDASEYKNILSNIR